MSPNSLLTTLLLLASLAAPPSSSRTTTKVFTSPGTKIVTLKVCNAAGACSTTTKTLVVLNPKPFLTSHTPVPPLVGSASLPLSLDAVFQGRPPLQPSWKVSASPLRPARSLPMARWLWFPDSFGAYTLSFSVRNSSGSASSPSYPAVVVPSTFSDVGPALPFANAVETLHARRIADPCSSSPPLFCPEPSLTRSEAALWIDRAAFATPPPPPAGLFSDVPPSHPAAAAIERLARSAFVLPCAPQRFCPGEPISRAQATAFLLRARLGASWTPPPASGLFADVPVFDPLAAYVEHFYRLGYTSGCSTLPRLFCPTAPVARGSMALFLASVFALEQAPTPLSFTVRACPHPCALPTRLPLRFDLAYSAGIPSSFDYDWAGDGTFEESSPVPLRHHVFTLPGTFAPTVRLRRGSSSLVVRHPFPITIAAANFFKAPPRPSQPRATFLATTRPTLGSPPDLPRALYRIDTRSQGATGFLVYLSLNGSPYSYFDTLPPDLSLPLALPRLTPTEPLRLYVVPFNRYAAGPASPSLALNQPPVP